MPKIGVLARNVLYENLCRTEVLYMSRLLKDRLQQHSTPGVLLYDQIESVTLVDAKWTQSVYIFSFGHFYACDVAGYRDIMPVSELLEHPS